MTSGSPRPLRNLLITALLVLSALPLLADQRKRGVRKPPDPGVIVSPPPAADASVVGTVVDAISNAPVIGADVFANSLGRYSRTGSDGVFTMKVPAGQPVDLTISRFGYQRFITTVNVSAAGVRQQFSMSPNPTVRVRTTAGVVHQLAAETVEFGYLVPLTGFVKDRTVTMCKPDGAAFAPKTDDMKRIQGPAVTVAASPCCSQGGSASGVTLEMRDGDRTQAFFADSCFGYAMEVIGLDQTKASLVDIKLTEISEIVFP